MIRLAPKTCRSYRHVLLLSLILPFAQFGYSQTAATFDINRYSTFGEGIFETYYVDQTQALQAALANDLVAETTQLLITHTATGNLALIQDQMAFHHIAQGQADGLDWMATF